MSGEDLRAAADDWFLRFNVYYPGVEVREMVGTFSERTGAWLMADDHYGIPATHRRLVIMLPAEPSAQRSAEGAPITEKEQVDG